MTLATVDKNGVPWASPVYYCMDENNNFYFASSPKSRHMKNIESNNAASFAIFDSTAPEGKGCGVQGMGTVKKLNNLELLIGMKYYISTFLKMKPSMYKEKGFYRLYKLTPVKFYVTDNDSDVDKRIQVKLNA